MYKFKVGDRVKVVRLTCGYDLYKHYLGKTFIIEFCIDNGYVFADKPGILWFDDELELVKPKFDINNYPGKYAMHVKNKEEDLIFRTYLRSIGKKWRCGQSYLDHSEYSECKDITCFDFNDNACCSRSWYIYDNYTILEFEDFDWSDFDIKKEFTKKDLKNGDFVKLRDGSIGIALVDIGAITFGHQVCCLDNICHDLTNSVNRDCDIMSVRRPATNLSCTIDIFDAKRGILVYERKEVEEMTLEEVCKALGKEIKIVKK